MERILVSATDCFVPGEALSRAIYLAKRINAKVYVLLVLEDRHHRSTALKTESGLVDSCRERLEVLIELGRRQGLDIDYFVINGDYQEEVIRFADRYQISLWVTEPVAVGLQEKHQESMAIERIRHRIGCRIEYVHPRG